jgi:flagellar basal-body rod protein FlgB
MFLSTITDRGAAPALVATLAFQETRLRMIAENVANMATPGYRAKQLDVRGFQAALGTALEARGGDPAKPLAIRAGDQVRTEPSGMLRVTPVVKPVENVLFHDGTNLSIEREMADLAETGARHELAAELLRRHFEGLRRAIRGTAA